MVDKKKTLDSFGLEKIRLSNPNIYPTTLPIPAPSLESWRGRTSGCSPAFAWLAQWLIACCTCRGLACSSHQWSRSSAASRVAHRVSLLSFLMEFPSWSEAWQSQCSSSCSSCIPWRPGRTLEGTPLLSPMAQAAWEVGRIIGYRLGQICLRANANNYSRRAPTQPLIPQQ